jgi:adenine specific DNA methylase Mod
MDGTIYVHLDLRMAAYARVMMDEIFGKDNFQSEIFGETQTPIARL